jgi:hypothetical protein
MGGYLFTENWIKWWWLFLNHQSHFWRVSVGFGGLAAADGF